MVTQIFHELTRVVGKKAVKVYVSTITLQDPHVVFKLSST